MHNKVKEYLKKLPSPQKEICEKVRKIILKTFPGTEESFKNGVPWYEDRFYIVGLKDHVNIGFCINGLSKEELNLFEGQGKFMRHIKIHSLADIDEKEIVKRLKVVK
jgi:hypothetical protein